MGLDRFANFISKSINSDCIDELNIDCNIKKIVSNHIIFDLNFIIYQEIIEIENETNDIIKTILALPFSYNNKDTLEKIIESILDLPHWKLYCNKEDIYNIIDGFNEDEIIEKFLSFITHKIEIPNYDFKISVFELIIYEKIINVICNYINKLHYLPFVQNISIFNDGIPSISKVIEQRRRRIKNYLESIEKKSLFKEYFNDLLPNNKNLLDNLSKKYKFDIKDNNIYFDYFKWIKNRFSIDKSIGPSSDFIKNLEKIMNYKIPNLYPKIKVYINSSRENGESDLKIFKYISANKFIGDYCIHTTDSDLIHQMLVQQVYYKIINKDINLTVVKYLKNYNLIGYIQVLDANLIIKNILDLYNSVNNLKTLNYKIIWDICLIFYLFGNDHLPSSLELGPELGLEFYLKNHYLSLSKGNIVNLSNDIINIDLKNLSLYLTKINETNKLNITKIILQRFFKINSYLITILVDKLELDFYQILKLLNNFIIYKGLQLSSSELDLLDDDDLRKKLIKNIIPEDLDKYKELSIFSEDNKINILMENIALIEKNIDYSSVSYSGLILYNKPLNITIDPYQDLYNYIIFKTNNNLNKKYPEFYDHLDIEQHLKMIEDLNNNSNSDNFLKKLYHLVLTQFGNMENYHADNLTFYKYCNVPSLDSLINYLNSDENNKLINIWNSQINEDNIINNKYLNHINHYFLITPFIKIYNLSNDIRSLTEKIDIKNLWFNQDNFNYRNIDIRQYLEKWDVLINGNHDKIISLNFDFI